MDEQLVLFDKKIQPVKSVSSTVTIKRIDGKTTQKTYKGNGKVCRDCGEWKDYSEYYVDSLQYYYRCKSCCKIAQQQLKKIKESAPPKPDRCECCGKDMEGKSFYCDHDHNLTKFRGWVCRYCNEAAGNVGDTYQGAVKLLNYLYERK